MAEPKKHFRAVPIRTLLKGTSIIMLAPIMLLLILSFYGKLEPLVALYGALFIFAISIIFVAPYIANLSALTNYVRQLSLDQKAEAPDLSFLNNVEELSEAVSHLHQSWENRRNQLEAIVAEGKLLIDSLPDILIMLDKDLNIIRSNRRAKEVFDGKYFKETLSNIVNDKELSTVIKNVMEDKEGRDVMFFLSEPWKRYYIVRVERFPTYSTGNIALIVVMHDITEQKNTEQMLSDFVANASHEIRTPLTSLKGFIETLQTTAKDDTEAHAEFLKIMEGQTERMSKLVKDLLSLSQIERNMHTSPKGKASISAILKDVKENAEISAGEKNIKINLDIESKLPKITCDKGEVTQVFENIIGNAVKYSKKGTEIKVEANLVDNEFSKEKSLAEFEQLISVSVTDKGEGIASEHISRLTERFYRIDTGRSRKVGGTGLGLSIVKHILDRHRGLLKVDSVVGEGSRFTVFLPMV